MDVAHCFGAQSLGLLLCFDSLYPPFCQQFLVELLQMQRRQIIQRDLMCGICSMTLCATRTPP